MKIYVMCCSLAAVFFAMEVQAKNYVYSPRIDEKKQRLEYYVDWFETITGRDIVTHELEYQYTLSHYDTAALSLVYGNRPDSGFDLQQYKLRWIHEMTISSARNMEAGLYFEYRIQTGKDLADILEFKPLVEKSLMQDRLKIIFNGIFDKEIGSGAKPSIEAGYAARVAWLGSKRINPAVELFGRVGDVDNIKPADEQSHFLGPVIDWQLTRSLVWQAGAQLGLTDSSNDIRVKSNLALEWN